MLRKELGLFLLIITIGIVTTILNPQFISPANLSNLANQIGLFGPISIGMGLVIITGGIDLSVGSLLALLGVIFLDLTTNRGWSWISTLALVTAAGTLIGTMHGFLITRLKLQPFVITLCGLLLYRGIARWYTDDSTLGTGDSDGADLLDWITTGRTMGVAHSFIFLLMVAVILGVVLHKTVFGRYLFAIGKNDEAARYAGIPVRAVTVAVYALMGLLTGLSSIFFLFYTQSVLPSSHGSFYELYAIAAAVLGGCSLRGGEGSILGVILGTALLQALQNLVNLLGIPSSLNFAVMGAVIFIGVVADVFLDRRRQARRFQATTHATSSKKAIPAA